MSAGPEAAIVNASFGVEVTRHACQASRMQKRTLSGVQAARGVAALLVVLYHATVLIEAPRYWGGAVLGGMFRFGDAGVPFFFVLSGFIIYWVHADDLGRRDRFGAYAFSRLTRIYPIYWLVMALVLVALAAVPGLGGWPSASVILRSTLLAGDYAQSVLPVAWTLYHEMLFYAVFAFAIALRWGLLLLGAWLALCALSLVGVSWGYLNAPINLLFGMGVLAAWLLRRGPVPLPLTLLAAGTAVFFAIGLGAAFGGYKGDVLAYGAASFLIVLGCVEAERSGKLRVPQGMRLLGDASYSLYLIHYTALSAIAKILTTAGIGPGAAFCLLVAGSVGCGLLLYLLVERPLLRAFKRWRSTGLGNPKELPA